MMAGDPDQVIFEAARRSARVSGHDVDRLVAALTRIADALEPAPVAPDPAPPAPAPSYLASLAACPRRLDHVNPPIDLGPGDGWTVAGIVGVILHCPRCAYGMIHDPNQAPPAQHPAPGEG